MPGRHQIAPTRRFGLRWILGAALAILVAAATALGLAITPANATSAVTATFGVTGVSQKPACPVSIGGSAVYVKPGQELDLQTSLVGINLNLLSGLSLSAPNSLGGTLVIDPPGSQKPQTYKLPDTKSITGLAAGNYPFTWTATSALGVPLRLNLGALQAGAKLVWTGTIHVTSDAADCGLSVSLPSVHVSASAPGLPPINVGIPGVSGPTLSVPTLPSLPGLPGGKQTQPGGGGGGTNPGGSNLGNGSGPVQQGVVPVGDNANVYPGAGAGGFNALPLPNILNSNGGTSGLLPVPAANTGAKATSKQHSAGKNKPVDLASNKSETGQLSVILAIIAVIALTLVAATYARLYVLRKN